MPITPRSVRRAALRGAVLALPVGLLALAAGPREALAVWLGMAAPIGAAALLEQSSRPRSGAQIAMVAAVSSLAVIAGAVLALLQGFVVARSGLAALTDVRVGQALPVVAALALVPAIALGFVVAFRLLDPHALDAPLTAGWGARTDRLLMQVSTIGGLVAGVIAFVITLVSTGDFPRVLVVAPPALVTGALAFFAIIAALTLLTKLIGWLDQVERRLFPLVREVELEASA